ncbi:phosphotransferase family protein [Kribbella sp. NPDC059898]|uniref:phosphotransferase family protein n=1 Tax=Kribbella sp. NPDC059898 TaxID=3346995 RepID=UPI00365F2380
MEEIAVVAAHSERATLRVGDMFLKVDADQARIDREVQAMTLAPVPTPEILWREPPVLALSAVPGTVLGRVGQPSTASPEAWAAAGAALRELHNAPAPPWPGRAGRPLDELTADLDRECERLIADDVLPADLVTRNRDLAEAALRPWNPAFTHGDLHIAHVFTAGTALTGIIDWSEAGQGDPLYDLASLTVAHQPHLNALLTGYATPVDLNVIHAWWSLRTRLLVRWLTTHGHNPSTPGGAIDVLRAQL